MISYLYSTFVPFIIFLFLVVAFSFLLREVPFLFAYFHFYLFFAVRGLHCCVGFSLVVARLCHSVVVVCGPLTEGAFLIVGHGVYACGFCSWWPAGFRARAQ